MQVLKHFIIAVVTFKLYDRDSPGFTSLRIKSSNYELGSDGSAQFAGSVSIGGTASANTIDEYEEGTWTPTIRENGNGTAWDTISANDGFYTKIGDCVTFSATFNYSGVATNVNSSFYGWLAGFPVCI